MDEMKSTPSINQPETPATPLPDYPMSPASPNQRPIRGWMIAVAICVLVLTTAVAWYLLYHGSPAHQTAAPIKKDVASISYGYDNNPLNIFYPADSANYGVNSMNEQLFEGLVEFKNGAQIVPDLAGSWSNPNDTTWVFKLKPNIHYHDGNSLTAQDVVYSWKQVNSQAPDIAAYATSTIKDVAVVNPSTVQITTTSPDPILLNRLTSLWIIDAKAPTESQPWELGTGPYTLKPGTTPSANNLNLVAFSGWHGGHIYVKAVNYVFIASSKDAVAGLEQGKLDVVDDITRQDVESLPTDKYYTFNEPNLAVSGLSFDTAKSSAPSGNAKIRQAIDLTLNPLEILNARSDSGAVSSQIVPRQVPGYDPTIVRPTSDLNKATQLVKDAGYPSGCTVVLGIAQPIQPVGVEIAKELKAVGITAQLDVATSENTFFANTRNGIYDMWYLTANTVLTDPSDIFSYWQNAPFYPSSTFNSEINAANQTFNATQRINDFREASKTMLTDNAFIPLFQRTSTILSKKGLVFPIGTYDYDLNSYFADVYQK